MTESKLDFVPTYERLPFYLHLAEEALAEERDFISGTEIAEILYLSPIQVRKDLSFAGLKGIPKRGYKTNEVVSGIKSFLTWDKNKETILIGAGNLGKAIVLHDEFRNCGLDIIAVFDNDRRKVGCKIGAIKVLDMEKLHENLKKLKPQIAILTLSYKNDIQGLASFLAENGIRGIWNFTKQKISLDQKIAVYNADFTSGLAVLCADMNRRTKQ